MKRWAPGRKDVIREREGCSVDLISEKPAGGGRERGGRGKRNELRKGKERYSMEDGQSEEKGKNGESNVDLFPPPLAQFNFLAPLCARESDFLLFLKKAAVLYGETK